GITASGGAPRTVQTAYSVVVAACTRRAGGGLRIVDDHPHAAGFVDHLDSVHRAPLVGHALGIQHPAAVAALDPADAVGQLVIAVPARLMALVRAGPGSRRRLLARSGRRCLAPPRLGRLDALE